MKHPAAALLLLLLACGAARADAWAEADIAVHRAAPADIGVLPGEVRTELERRGCRIPQPFNAKRLENFAQGSFLARKAKDWAVLCSVGRVSRVLVFPGGSSEEVHEVPGSRRKDFEYLQATGGGAIGFSRRITAITPSAAHRYQRAYAPKNDRVKLRHDGIEDAFVDKASEVLYFDGDRWMRAQGAD